MGLVKTAETDYFIRLITLSVIPLFILRRHLKMFNDLKERICQLNCKVFLASSIFNTLLLFDDQTFIVSESKETNPIRSGKFTTIVYTQHN